MHIFNAGGSARWGPVPFMKKNADPKTGGDRLSTENRQQDQSRCAEGERYVKVDMNASVEP